MPGCNLISRRIQGIANTSLLQQGVGGNSCETSYRNSALEETHDR